jgi:hypothetical protein
MEMKVGRTLRLLSTMDKFVSALTISEGEKGFAAEGFKPSMADGVRFELTVGLPLR